MINSFQIAFWKLFIMKCQLTVSRELPVIIASRSTTAIGKRLHQYLVESGYSGLGCSTRKIPYVYSHQPFRYNINMVSLPLSLN